jgi:protein dithiol:quinone oxidoreductase
LPDGDALTMKRLLDARPLCAVAVSLPVVAVGVALYTQHGLGMEPCPWCVLQRVIFLAISLAALPGLLAGGALARWLSGPLVGLLALSGVATALWQHFVASSSTSCALTLADRVVRGMGLDELKPEVFAAYASCADAKATLLGVPYEFYSLTLFVLLGAGAVALLRSR